jgi:hypothetical protein
MSDQLNLVKTYRGPGSSTTLLTFAKVRLQTPVDGLRQCRAVRRHLASSRRTTDLGLRGRCAAAAAPSTSCRTATRLPLSRPRSSAEPPPRRPLTVAQPPLKCVAVATLVRTAKAQQLISTPVRAVRRPPQTSDDVRPDDNRSATCPSPTRPVTTRYVYSREACMRSPFDRLMNGRLAAPVAEQRQLSSTTTTTGGAKYPIGL